MNINRAINKDLCCGCEACRQACPVKAIRFREDSEGFFHPVVDESACVDCGRCLQVCPIAKQGEKTKPEEIYAAINNDESARKASSSGGVFSVLAKDVIAHEGYVYGAAFNDNWDLKHKAVSDIVSLLPLMGSKYIQSRIGNVFVDIKNHLSQNHPVLFVGTPCQVAGLKVFLNGNDEHLLSVDFVCKGVPSGQVFKQYIKETLQNRIKRKCLSDDTTVQIDEIRFRDKVDGWNDYKFVLSYTYNQGEITRHDKICQGRATNPFMRGFLQNLFLRLSCYQCPFRERHQSDITLADFWGIEKTEIESLSDNHGVSAVLINNDKGKKTVEKIKNQIILYRMNLDCFGKYNQGFYQSPNMTPRREQFYKLDMPFDEKIDMLCDDKKFRSLKRFFIRLKYGFTI